ncbi:hypothetical protein [Pontibacter ruber]|uniref:Uncharacterized protein n=2 Tax=Pontibacter ruber TaxID=1343895 RepID=A0ABW5CXN8_9BACT
MVYSADKRHSGVYTVVSANSTNKASTWHKEERMGLFYKATTKELLEARNQIVLEIGIPLLEKKGFKKTPFSTSWFGRDNLHGYIYELCRLTPESELQVIEIQIVRGDKWIKFILNIFKLNPNPESLDQLIGVDGLQYKLPPNSITEMHLGIDDIKGPPLFDYNFMFRKHKIGSFYTKSGLDKRIKQLRKIIEKDLDNIEHFVERWHEMHEPLVTTWEGHLIEGK